MTKRLGGSAAQPLRFGTLCPKGLHRETFILPEAMADAEIAGTELVFYNRQKAYLVTYELVNAWDLSAFQNNRFPSADDNVTYGIWISAKDGTVLADGIASEFFDSLTAFFCL